VLHVNEIKVRSFSLDYLGIFWQISPVAGPSRDSDQHEIFDYDFYVLRSEAPMGPYEQIGGPLKDIYSFRDNTVLLRHKWRSYYYKIKVVHRLTGDVDEFGPGSNTEPPPDLIAQEIVRIEDVIFREHIGRKCWLFPIRTFGPRCSCYDAVAGRQTRSSHQPCYGTGFLGGFLAPVEVFVQFDPTGKNTAATPLREEVANATRARMISFPPASPRDILIEAENRRWRVVSVDGTERLRSTVHQELTLKEIDKGDIEFSIPLNIDPASLEPASQRNFKNAHNIEDDGDYQDIFAFFGDPRRAR
jgi:hypothetical protein